MKELSEEIADELMRELARHRSEINSDRDLVQVRLVVDLVPGTREISSTKVSRDSVRSRA